MTARTDADAERQIKGTIVDRDVRDVVIALVRWKPPAHLESEKEYEASFVRSLAKRGITKDQILLKERITWSADDRHGGGSRVGIPDLIVKNKVLVELKANLSGAEAADRAMGQMLRYLLAWKGRGPAVLAVCGESSPEIRFLIRTYMKIWRDTLRLPVTVVFRRSDERVSYEPGETPA